MSDDPRLPKASDFPPGTQFVVKEFDVPLVNIPGKGWFNYYHGGPCPYDESFLKVDNNWPADSFDQWMGVVEASMGGKKVVVDDAEYESLRGQLDPKDPQFARKVHELFLAAARIGAGGLGKKIALLTYLVENDLAPAEPGIVIFHTEPVQMFDLVSLYEYDPQAIELLTTVCEYEVAKYPDDQMVGAQAKVFLRPPEHMKAEEGKVFLSPIEAMLERFRKDPAEAEKRWQSGREWHPEAHAEREKAHRLFRLIESKAKRE